MSKKKKQMTTIIALVVVLAVVCIGYFALIKSNEKKEKAADTSVSLLQLDSSLATELTMTNSNGTMTFKKSDDTWQLTSDDTFVVKEDAMNAAVEQFATLTASQCVVESKENAADYGLDEPSATATLTLSDGSTATLNLGSSFGVTGEYYGAIDDKEAIYTFTADTVACFLSDKTEFSDESNLSATE